MNVLFKDVQNEVRITVLKQYSDVAVDWRRADMRVFLCGRNDKWPLVAEAEDGVLVATVPAGLPADVYDLQVVWTTNQYSRLDVAMPGGGDKSAADVAVTWKRGPEGLGRWNANSSLYSMAYVPHVFALSGNVDEATEGGQTSVVNVSTRMATYGYDGLNSYELAVFSGRWEGTMGEWLERQNNIDIAQTTGEGQYSVMSQKAVTAEVDRLMAGIETKADADNVYTMAQVNAKLAEKAAVSDVYTKGQSDSALLGKADKSSVYVKAEVDKKLQAKAEANSVYTKNEVDTKLLAKAEASGVYSKSVVDAKLKEVNDAIPTALVSTSGKGLMSPEDKAALDRLAAGNVPTGLNSTRDRESISISLSGLAEDGNIEDFGQEINIPAANDNRCGLMLPEQKTYIDKVRKSFIFKSIFGGTFAAATNEANAYMDNLVTQGTGADGMTVTSDGGNIVGVKVCKIMLVVNDIAMEVFVAPIDTSAKKWVQIVYNAAKNSAGKMEPTYNGGTFRRESKAVNGQVVWSAWEEIGGAILA